MAFNAFKARLFLSDSDSIVNLESVKSMRLTRTSNYKEICDAIEALVKSLFPHSSNEVHCFGSRIIGLASDNSDLDIFVDIDQQFYSSYAASNKKDYQLKQMASALRKNPREWRIKSEILKARIPLLVCVYEPMELNCDISITNGLSVCNSKLLAHLFHIQPEAVSLYHFIKLWLQYQDFEAVKGYTLTLLVLFFLQNLKLMPTIEGVQNNLPKQFIDAWEVQFDENRTLESYKITKILNYKNLIKEFFKFYQDFDFSKVILPYTGQTSDGKLYKRRYPTFRMIGLLVAGPINKSINCGITTPFFESRFNKICSDSTVFLNAINFSSY